jgi:Ca2+-binding EF-hand superfamily protein
VVQGAMKLEQEKAYETMLLTGWITQFNDQMRRNSHPLDNLFLEFDEQKEGSLTFEQFIKMNDFVGVSLPKNDLFRIYNMVDRNKSGIVRLQELRVIVNQQYKISDEDKLEEIIGDDQWDVIEHKTLTAD